MTRIAKLKSAESVTAGMVQGLELLLDAYCYAQEVSRDHWDFAVEIQSLQATGINNTELRWLVCKGFVKHAEEEAAKNNGQRVFQAAGDTTFRKRSCFVLTRKGFDAYKQWLPQKQSRSL